MRDSKVLDPRQATLNQIANVIDYVNFGATGTVGKFTSKQGSVGVEIANYRDGCGGGSTFDTKLYKPNGVESRFFTSKTAAEKYLIDELAPTPLSVPSPVEDERGHTYAPPSSTANVKASARC